MQIRIRTENPERIKAVLRTFSRQEIEFNEPHFSLKLHREKIDRNEIMRSILNPDKLALVGISKSKNPNYKYVYDLYFKLSKNRILKIPVSIKAKSLYAITVFKIRTRIQHEAIKYK